MIEYHEEIPKLSFGKFIRLHEACISLESNNQHDNNFERGDVKTSISVLLTEQEAEKVIDWYICTQMRTTFIRLYQNIKCSDQHIDRKIVDVYLYQVKNTDDYLLQVNWKAQPFTKEQDFSICSECGDPCEIKDLKLVNGERICWCCEAGRH